MASKKKPDPFLIDDENPELTEAEIGDLQPAGEMFAALGIDQAQTANPRGRPKLDKPKLQVTLRLDAEVIEHFKQGGKGWQSRLNETLLDKVRSEAK